VGYPALDLLCQWSSGGCVERPPSLKRFTLLRRARSSWAFCYAQARPFTPEFFIPLLDAVPGRRVLAELGPKTSLHRYNLTAFVHTQGPKKPPLSASAQFSPNLLTWRPATKLSVRDMHKQTWGVPPPVCESHIQDLSVIPVYQFCEMCW